MKKNVWAFGLVAGFISIIGFIVFTIFPEAIDMQSAMYYGFASMLLGLSLIFVAVKNYRDKYNNGIITFKKAFLMGLYISLIASTIYVVTWLIEYYFILDNFWAKMAEMHGQSLAAAGVPAEKIATEVSQIKEYEQFYEDYPLFAALYTYIEILPIGIVISLLVAAILKKKTAATV
ncbi:DUF4199 domain-containing protein [Flavobacterium sp.]|uniref:DUF4199 domain-containing protein n=1 Tax=Flavobacterium sp. TaxID=239 RepID=UPI002607C315|nr:DUF4199 domain-containing protein [Flavobacterium sp.]